MMINKISISFGAISPPIKDQVNDQGLSISADLAGWYDDMIGTMITMKIKGFVTHSECDKIFGRIIKDIAKHVDEKANDIKELQR